MAVLKITPAQLVWDEQGLPRSEKFNDLYFSAENGLEETRYVFLQGNHLQERWKTLKDDERFVIAETGFGSGLNLLATADLWQKTAPQNAQLHFISTELFPMQREDLKRTLSHWPELDDLSQALIDNYPALTPGFHRFSLTDNIQVTLILDDVISAFSELAPTLASEMWNYKNWSVDAWFLDGFAPSENPDMWAEDLFPLIHRLSSETATAATFTSAGMAKRGLKAWGFDIEKIPGYGRKREMLIARRNQNPVDLSSRKQPHRMASACWHLDATQPPKPKAVAIIGAGIAGCTLAEALSVRGIKATLFDAGNIASGASGNPQAALYARLSPEAGDLEDFCLHALEYAAGYYTSRISKDMGDLCGLVQLARNEREAEKLARIGERFENAPDFCQYMDAGTASTTSGVNLNEPALYLPKSGWINGPAFCQHLIKRSGAVLKDNTRVQSIARTTNSFLLYSEKEELGEFDAVVFSTAMGTLSFPEADWLPVRPIRGQISFLQNQRETKDLKTVLCQETYLTPADQGLQSVGATYDLDSDSNELKPEDHQTNLEALQALLALDSPIDVDIDNLQGRASTRTTTPDYLPIVGSLPSLHGFVDQYQLWRKDRKRAIPEPHDGHKGLYLNLGYGSRGYTYAPLCAELLAAKIAQEPEPLPVSLQRALHPARFLVRALARNKPIGNSGGNIC